MSGLGSALKRLLRVVDEYDAAAETAENHYIRAKVEALVILRARIEKEVENG